MASAGLDLNQDPPHDESDVNLEPASLHPSSDPGVINWDGIQEWDGPAHELDYDFVWHGNGDDGECELICFVSFDLCVLICLLCQQILDGDEQGEGTEVGHGDPANANEPDESSDYEGDWHYVPIAPAHGGGGSRNARNQGKFMALASLSSMVL